MPARAPLRRVSEGGSSRLLAVWFLIGAAIVGYALAGRDAAPITADAVARPSAATALPSPAAEGSAALSRLPPADGRPLHGPATILRPLVDGIVYGDGLVRVEALVPSSAGRRLEAVVSSGGSAVTSAAVPVAADGRASGWVRVDPARLPRAMRLSLRAPGYARPLAEVPFYVGGAPSLVLTQPLLPYAELAGDRVIVGGRVEAIFRQVRIELRTEAGSVLSSVSARSVRDGPRATTPAGFYAELPLPAELPPGVLWIVAQPLNRPEGLLEARLPVIAPGSAGGGSEGAPSLSRPGSDELVPAQGYLEVAGTTMPYTGLRAVVVVDGGGTSSLKLNVSDDGRFFAYLPLRVHSDRATTARIELYATDREAVPVRTVAFRVGAAPDVVLAAPLLPYEVVSGTELVVAGRADDSVDLVRLRLEDATGRSIAELDVPARHRPRVGRQTGLGFGRGPGSIDFVTRLQLPGGLPSGVAYLVAQPMAGERSLEAARLPVILARTNGADRGTSWFGNVPGTPAPSP
jgi:hypothetical protein